MIENASRRPGRPVDYACKRIEPAHYVQTPISLLRNIYRDEFFIIKDLRQVPNLGDVANRVGGKQDGYDFSAASRVDDGDPRVGLAEEIVFRAFVMSSSLEFLSIGKHYAGPVLTRQVFGPERPSGADNQVTGHFEPVGFVKYSLEHIYPLVAQIIQRSDIQFVCRSRVCNGIDFHSSYPGFVQQI